MANNNFTADITNGQYQKGSYTTPEGIVRSGIHVFTTLSRSYQRIVPMVSTSKRVALSDMNPNSRIASASDVIAKINGNVFASGPLGINYEGASGNLYIGSFKHASPPAVADVGYADLKFNPSFCVKSNGDAVIRWFSSPEKMQAAMDACDCIIAGAHAIVFDGKCTTDEDVRDNEAVNWNDRILIYNTNGDQSETRWDTSVYASEDAEGHALRCCLGHKADSNGVYIMVCTDSYVSLHEMANLMKLLGCDYAVNLDGNNSVQMRIKNGYGASGKVTSASGSMIYAGIAAYLV